MPLLPFSWVFPHSYKMAAVTPGFTPSHLSKCRKGRGAFLFLFSREGNLSQNPLADFRHFGQTESHASALAAGGLGKGVSIVEGKFYLCAQGEQAWLQSRQLSVCSKSLIDFPRTRK